ncbi:hypothetical protein JTB14_000008 [Gonioctena quinquepunctata]|nr:hypothetical protein JTB14_000008 [Gonioctena quinquepunctata]
MKRDAWRDICDIIIPKFSKKAEEEKQEIGKAVQVKWENLRNAFVRHRRQKKSHIDSHIKQPSPDIRNQPKETDHLAFFRSLQTSHSG